MLICALLSIWSCDTMESGASSTTPVSLQWSEAETSVTLNGEGTCTVNDKTGVIPDDLFAKTWKRLMVELEVTSFSSGQLTEELLREIKNTGLVVNADPLHMTRLEVGTEDDTQIIEFANLAARHRAYPEAQSLARFNSVSEAMKGVANHCKVS